MLAKDRLYEVSAAQKANLLAGEPDSMFKVRVQCIYPEAKACLIEMKKKKFWVICRGNLFDLLSRKRWPTEDQAWEDAWGFVCE